ncbi:ParA family protein [Ectothiorhodospiraceae bacterium BW-2]|nr:ParA family protein [Ectothiorhodospiraceae bacterium BW-2]
MAKVIAVANQKGGVAKTTTCINIGASLVATKRRVLVVDLDPQANATVGSGIDRHQLLASCYHLILGKKPIHEVMLPKTPAGYALVPTSSELTAAEVELMSMYVGREKQLKKGLEPITDQFDYIFIDCPPSLNMLTLNALVAADSVMIPMQCEYYALEGLSALLQTIEQIQDSVNRSLEIEGILRTMFDPRNNLAKDVSEQLLEHFGEKVYRTTIPRNIRLAESPSHGLPVFLYDKSSRGSKAYLALAGEMLSREESRMPNEARSDSVVEAASVTERASLNN